MLNEKYGVESSIITWEISVPLRNRQHADFGFCVYEGRYL